MPTPSPTAPVSSPLSVPDPDEVVREIAAIAAAELELPAAVTPDARLLEDLALDSLGLTVIAVGLENRFRIRLREEDAEGIRTVRDLAALVVRRVEEQRA
ncbi:MAG: acyl carrier protein [Myxococcaceae bacterium]|nr:acyl carrier protein [Myxococcaceae bacterium]